MESVSAGRGDPVRPRPRCAWRGYFGIPFVGLCYLFFWWRYGRKGVAPRAVEEEAPVAW